jgi:hypothetical protein
MVQNGKSYFGAYSMKLKGQCSRAVIFDYDNGFDKNNPEATSQSLRFDAYWSQSSFPYDLYNDVGAVKVYAKPAAPVTPPPALAMSCELMVFDDRWYQGHRKTFSASSPTGYFIPASQFNGNGGFEAIYSFKAHGHCDKIVIHSKYDGNSACKIRHKYNAKWDTNTDATHTDKFGCGDLKDEDAIPGSKDAVYDTYVCGITIFSKTATDHSNTACPNRHEQTFPIKTGKRFHTDSAITQDNTFCMQQAFEESP